jgi:glucose/arabinose dehydrogenase
MRGARARSNVGVRPTVLAAGLAGLVAGACGAEREAPAARGSAAGETSPGDTGAGGISAGRTSVRPACALDNGGLTLPAGFCATVFADSVGGARHIAVAANGDVFVARSSPGRARAGNESGQGARVGVLALRDADGDGRADRQETFGRAGGTGIALAPGWVYVDEGPQVVRYPVRAGALAPTGEAQTVVSGLPMGGHAAHNMLLDGRGGLFVNVGSRTNSCQRADRQTGSPGVDPCVELETRAGIWRYAADSAGQRFSPGERYATGIRNAMGLAVDPRDGAMYATQHGRDQLLQTWPQQFTAEQSAELPAEELVRVSRGADFGWPYCYYDQRQRALVLAPEYGGDGKAVGRCSGKQAPVAAFPGHWAPMSAAFYTGRQFPARYRDGVFVAFHGSWNRAPLPQAGYNVTFVPMRGGQAAGEPERFADGFAGAARLANPGAAKHRPVGLAVAPDGGLYVSDDVGGRIWKIVYTGTGR